MTLNQMAHKLEYPLRTLDSAVGWLPGSPATAAGLINDARADINRLIDEARAEDPNP